MAREVLTEAAAIDLERLTDFLLQRFPVDAMQREELIAGALKTLEAYPYIGRPVGFSLRELVISRK